MSSAHETTGLDVDFDLIDHLPISHYIKQELEKAAVAIASELGSHCVCLTLYGSVARDEWNPATSDVNLAVVLDAVDYAALEPLQGILSRTRRLGRIIPLILSVEDLTEATDVFPIKFDDIRRHHIHIGGRDVFADLDVEPRDLAFVSEFKLRNVEWRLRQAFVGSFGDRGWEEQLLLTHFSSAMFPLRAACRVMGHEIPGSTNDAITAVEQALGLDATVLRTLQKLHRTKESLSQDALTQLYFDFSQFIHAAVGKVNALNR